MILLDAFNKKSVLFFILFCQLTSNNFLKGQNKDSKTYYNQLEKIAELMDANLMDSAFNLSINEELSLNVKKVDYKYLYFLKTFQSEILYYNSLFELGYERANEAFFIAENFLNKDSILISNCYNLMGINAENFMPYEKVKVYYEKSWNSFPINKVDLLYFSKKWHVSSNLGQLLIKNFKHSEGKKWIHLSNDLSLKNKQFRTLAINYTAILNSLMLENNITNHQPFIDSLEKYTKLCGQKDVELFQKSILIQLQFYKKDIKKGLNLISLTEKFIENENNTLTEYSKFTYYNEVGSILKKNGFENLSTQYKVLEQNVKISFQETVSKIRLNVLKEYYEGKIKLMKSEKETSEKNNEINLTKKQHFQTLLIYTSVLLLLCLLFIIYYFKNQQIKQQTKSENQKKELENELGKTEERLDAIMQERKRLKMEFHDGIVPNLSAWKLIIETELRNKLNGKMIDKVPDLIDQIIKDIRNLIDETIPEILKNKGLHEAVIKQFEIHKISKPNIDFILKSNIQKERLDLNVEFNLFRIIQEAVQNAIKHSNSKKIIVEIEKQNKILKLSITDFGTNTLINNNLDHLTGMGLKNMKKRAEYLGGVFNINASFNQGTSINIQINL